MNRAMLLLLVALLVVAAVQLPKIGRQPFDHHNFRQAQTAATIELFARDGIDLLHPRTDYVGEPGTFVLEFPVFQAVGALLFRASHGSLVPVRALNILFTLGSAAALWVFTRRCCGPGVAAGAAVLFLGSPLNQAYMGSILIDPMAVCLVLWSFVAGQRILSEGRPSGKVSATFAICCVVAGLIKPLYLFPVGVLWGCSLVERRRLDRWLALVSFTLLLSAGLALGWNHYATEVNDASPFTRGIRPTTLLGVSQVLELSFYRRIGHRLIVDVLGPVGGVLAIIGWISALLRRHQRSIDRQRLLLVSAMTVFGYWLCFANIIFPHDYYSLVVVPFCAVAASFGCAETAEWMAQKWRVNVAANALATFGAVFGLGVFMVTGGFASPPALGEFSKLTAGRFARGSFGMIFVGPQNSPGGPPIHEAPAMLYAAGLLGTGLVVADSDQALERWNALRPNYRHLRYAIFYGIAVPEELSRSLGAPLYQIPDKQFTAYELPVAD